MIGRRTRGQTPVIPVGAHLRVNRGAYWHHAIHIGAGVVVHYAGLTKSKATATVRRESLEAFCNGDPQEIVPYSSCFAPNFVVARALSRLGEKNYDLVGNNCEHFARWCKTGHQTSQQVTQVAAGTITVGAGGALAGTATGGILAVGEAAGLAGGAKVMRGLAKVGSLVGGGAPAGLVLAMAAPVAVAVKAVRSACADDETLSATERQARRYARRAAGVAAVVGVTGSIAAVSAVGISGLSAVGISTGLAGIGKLVGGRMVAGVVVTTIIPVLLVGLASIIFYRLGKGESCAPNPGWRSA